MVDILVATYNGEKYIATQLHSLLSQSYSDIKIIVHDDGSQDKTVDIIDNIAKMDNRIVLIKDNVHCGGAGKNFMYLLKYSTADYVMFCDQDDLWFDNKVEIMLKQINKGNSNIPLVVYSNSYIWYPEVGIDGTLMPTRPISLRDFLFLNSGIQGCASIFNSCMREELLKWTGELSMHDHVLQLIGLSFGKIKYIESALMLYRRHLDSVTGRMEVKISLKNRLIKNRQLPVVSIDHFNTVKQFFAIYKDSLDECDNVIIKEYLLMKEYNLFGRLLSALKFRFRIFDSLLLLLLKICIRPYVGKI